MTTDEPEKYCPNCESTEISSRIVTEEFIYGVKGATPPPVMLSAEVLMFECLDCGERWTGEQGEAARQAAVDAHLKRTRI
jgi:uncharacterized Zn finger protein